MKHGDKILSLAVVAFMSLACITAIGCKKPEEDNHTSFTDTATGLEFSDSIIVNFGNERWVTLDYSSHMEHDELYGYDWILVDAHKPGVTYPAVKMKFFEDEGVHSAQMTVNNTGLGYRVPGEMYGDPQCGYALYYEKGEVSSPDGTHLSDWRTKEITMEVMKYIDSSKLATAYIHGTMFDYGTWYRSWMAGEPIDIDSVETRPFSITFADLPVIHN